MRLESAKLSVAVAAEGPHSWSSPTRQTAFSIASEAEGFIKREGLESEFKQVRDQLVKAFDTPEKVTVELVSSPEDDDESGENMVFRVKSGLDGKDFRRATEEFFASFRSVPSRLYPLMGVLCDI